MRQHGGGGAARNQFLEVADISLGLYGGAGVAAGVRHLAGRASAGVQVGAEHSGLRERTRPRVTPLSVLNPHRDAQRGNAAIKGIELRISRIPRIRKTFQRKVAKSQRRQAGKNSLRLGALATLR